MSLLKLRYVVAIVLMIILANLASGCRSPEEAQIANPNNESVNSIFKVQVDTTSLLSRGFRASYVQDKIDWKNYKTIEWTVVEDSYKYNSDSLYYRFSKIGVYHIRVRLLNKQNRILDSLIFPVNIKADGITIKVDSLDGVTRRFELIRPGYNEDLLSKDSLQVHWSIDSDLVNYIADTVVRKLSSGAHTVHASLYHNSTVLAEYKSKAVRSPISLSGIDFNQFRNVSVVFQAHCEYSGSLWLTGPPRDGMRWSGKDSVVKDSFEVGYNPASRLNWEDLPNHRSLVSNTTYLSGILDVANGEIKLLECYYHFQQQGDYTYPSGEHYGNFARTDQSIKISRLEVSNISADSITFQTIGPSLQDICLPYWNSHNEAYNPSRYGDASLTHVLWTDTSNPPSLIVTFRR